MRLRYLVLVAAAACSSDDTAAVQPCGPNGECPSGYTCDAHSRCVKSGSVGSARTFTATGDLKVARTDAASAAIAGGRALIAGGWNKLAGTLTSAEIYDPVSGTFSLTGSMATGHLWAGYGRNWPVLA